MRPLPPAPATGPEQSALREIAAAHQQLQCSAALLYLQLDLKVCQLRCLLLTHRARGMVVGKKAAQVESVHLCLSYALQMQRSLQSVRTSPREEEVHGCAIVTQYGELDCVLSKFRWRKLHVHVQRLSRL